MARRKKNHSNSSLKKVLFFILIVAGVAFLGFRYVKSALTLLNRDRVNIVVYGKKTAVYSLGLREAGNYVIPYYQDLKVEVPGGYGTYRVGGIGKLISLEKKPDILKKTFSLAMSTFIDYYFYPSSQEVYFGGADKKVVYPGPLDILLHNSNASIGEKIALAYVFLKTQPQNFSVVATIEKESGGERYLLTDNFSQQYQGYFYNEAYRNEKKDVQILYSKSYESAGNISKILEGNGIRVSDISQSAGKQDHCTVKEQSSPFSETSVAISRFFGCELVHGKTDLYDILVELSNRERDW